MRYQTTNWVGGGCIQESPIYPKCPPDISPVCVLGGGYFGMIDRIWKFYELGFPWFLCGSGNKGQMQKQTLPNFIVFNNNSSDFNIGWFVKKKNHSLLKSDELQINWYNNLTHRLNYYRILYYGINDYCILYIYRIFVRLDFMIWWI